MCSAASASRSCRSAWSWTSAATLLISGPNTGGKTVTLKTVGLLSLMAQSGLPVPAAEAEFPLFEQVLADIGDYQSIQENLSTFSAHISNIREMALDVTPDSLVLLDELGAATDPEEGGALGVAIVEHFRAAGAFTLVSTHLMALKIYGASTEGVVNGSMGFDEQTLEPTYVLHTGLPGKSAGLEIATRLGMPEDIMQRARESLSDRERDVTRFLSELHRRMRRRAARWRRTSRQQAGRAGRARKRDRARMGEARIRQAEGTGAPHRAGAGEVRGAGAGNHRQDRRRAPSERKAPSRRSAAWPRPSASCARISRPPCCPPRMNRGRAISAAADRGRRARAAAGRARAGARAAHAGQRPHRSGSRLHEDAGLGRRRDRGAARGRRAPRKLPKDVSYRPAPELAPVHQEINVIGQRAEEARDAVDEFLDRAVMATASRVRIVHGHGMGILKQDHPGAAGAASARGEVLSGAAAGRRRRRDDCRTEGVRALLKRAVEQNRLRFGSGSHGRRCLGSHTEA